MNWKPIVLAGSLGLGAGLQHAARASDSADRLREFTRSAASFKSVIAVPSFEQTTNDIRASVKQAIAAASAALDQVGALAPDKVTFENTIRALDDISYQVSLTGNRLGLIKETSSSAPLRTEAAEGLKEIEQWMVGLDYREDVYKAVKAYADSKPELKGEDARLLAETMRDYRRAGLGLPKAERDEVERLRKELTRLTTDYESNINKAQRALKFTKAELDGVPESFLQQIKTGNDEYTAKVNVTWHNTMIMENARREETRKRFLIEHDNLARAENIPLLELILPLRDTIARKLEYKSWADFKTEVRMAKDAATAIDFLQKLKTGLEPKFQAELAAFRRLKIKQTGNLDAQVAIWDWRFLSEQLKKEKFAVDAEQLRVFFPYERVLEGMFRIYQDIFGLKFERVDPPYKWVEDLQLYAVSDAKSGEPLGLFYLDMFPRDGKYNHFAHFAIIEGKLLPNGSYQRPTVALICNFPSPSNDRPSLLSHREVETLFHEFGHAMHSMMTRAHAARFSGTSVPRDFVEAPSQMLQSWVWDKTVLDSFAGDYRDPAKKIPAVILAKLKEARLATEGTRYRRQISFGLTDLMLHSQINESNAKDALPLSNKILSEAFLPMAPDTAFVAYFGHLMHYDAGYYGYAWADAIAADMETVFERSPQGYADTSAGMRLRRDIYEPGHSRDVNESIEKFLGRPRSLEPFLKKIGIGG